MVLWKTVILFAACVLNVLYSKECCDQMKPYFSLERPRLIYYDSEYVGNVSIIARRINRSNFNYYLNITCYIKKTWKDNNLKHHIYFYQLLSNVYKRSFVEFHFGICNMLETNNVVNVMAQKAFNQIPESERPMPVLKCPIKPGFYRLEGLEVPTSHIPKNFPFNEGRLFYNVTLEKKNIVSFYTDFQLKTVRV